LLICTAIGSGVLALPKSVNNIGIIPGALFTAGSGLLAYATLKWIISASYKTKKYNYSEIIQDQMGVVKDIVFSFFKLLFP